MLNIKYASSKGWDNLVPNTWSQLNWQLKNCGSKCFLGPDGSFPVCTKNTCKVCTKGLYAAYISARQWGKNPDEYTGQSHRSMPQSTYKNIALSAKSRLQHLGYSVGK